MNLIKLPHFSSSGFPKNVCQGCHISVIWRSIISVSRQNYCKISIENATVVSFLVDYVWNLYSYNMKCGYVHTTLWPHELRRGRGKDLLAACPLPLHLPLSTPIHLLGPCDMLKYNDIIMSCCWMSPLIGTGWQPNSNQSSADLPTTFLVWCGGPTIFRLLQPDSTLVVGGLAKSYLRAFPM